jgi:hypothetical protein
VEAAAGDRSCVTQPTPSCRACRGKATTLQHAACALHDMLWCAVSPSPPPHNSSSGTFEGSHIGDWYQDTQEAVLQLAGPHKKIIVGEACLP